MSDDFDGVRTTFERPKTSPLVGVGLFLLGGAALLIVARSFLSDVYSEVGPTRSADITILLALVAVFVGVAMLAIVAIAAYIQTRMSKYQQPAPNGVTATELAQLLQVLSLQSARPDAPKIARLPSGNWAGPVTPTSSRARDQVELSFSDDTSASVTLEAWRSAMDMPRLTRVGWTHANDSYKHIRRYLLDHGAIDEGGVKDHELCHRLDRAVRDSVSA